MNQAQDIPLLVGVVGHRDLVPAEVPEIRAAVRQLLLALRDAEPAVRIQLLTAQAAGADLLVAEVARELGLGIVALLPFSIAQCRAELTDDPSRAQFDATLAGAEVLELSPAATADSAQGQRDLQFERAGELIARHCALMIAIWDGLDTQHRAGTARSIERRRGRIGPVDAREPVAALNNWMSAPDNDLVYEIRCSRLATTEPAGIEVIGFVGGDAPAASLQQGLPSGLATLLAKTAEFNRDCNDYGHFIAGLGRSLAPADAGAVPATLGYIDRLFVAADWLAVHFRRSFTRALVARFGLWALMAWLLLGFKHAPDGLGGFIKIAAVLLVFGLGWALAFAARRRGWDRRYLEYRALAEGLRVDFYWELSGVRASYDDAFAHEGFLQKQDSQIEWIRAAIRVVTLRCALAAPAAVPRGFELAIGAWVGDPAQKDSFGQAAYYRQRSARLTHRVEVSERAAQLMLAAGLGLALLLAANVALPLLGEPAFLAVPLRNQLLMALALLTAYTAIFEVYLAEKADRALIRQYHHMGALFALASQELGSARSRPEKLAILRALGHACLTEHAQWILSHRDRRIDGMRW